MRAIDFPIVCVDVIEEYKGRTTIPVQLTWEEFGTLTHGSETERDRLCERIANYVRDYPYEIKTILWIYVPRMDTVRFMFKEF